MSLYESLQDWTSCTPVLIVPAGGRLMYRSWGWKVHSIQYTCLYKVIDVCKRQRKTTVLQTLSGTNPDMIAKDRRKVLTAFLPCTVHNVSNTLQFTDISLQILSVLYHCSQITFNWSANFASSVETDQPDPIADIETNEESPESDEKDFSIPSDPKDLLNSLELHLLDSRKRRVEELHEQTSQIKVYWCLVPHTN